jgi:hypothetical protein
MGSRGIVTSDNRSVDPMAGLIESKGKASGENPVS